MKTCSVRIYALVFACGTAFPSLTLAQSTVSDTHEARVEESHTASLERSTCRLLRGPDVLVARAIDGETLQLVDGREVRLVNVLAPRLPLAADAMPQSAGSRTYRRRQRVPRLTSQTLARALDNANATPAQESGSPTMPGSAEASRLSAPWLAADNIANRPQRTAQSKDRSDAEIIWPPAEEARAQLAQFVRHRTVTLWRPYARASKMSRARNAKTRQRQKRSGKRRNRQSAERWPTDRYGRLL
ncbi:MAG: hypothetical protein AAGJ70_05710, partial [Pseudomonadota bacterium]